MRNKARFSGRQKAPVLSPAKAGSESFSTAVPRAALRSTSFRFACPGLNSAASSAGLLNGARLTLLWLGLICSAPVFFSSCNRPPANESKPADKAAIQEIRSSADVVKIQAASVSIPAGGNTDATISISISPGFHVNANPATFSYLIPTEVTAGKIEGIAVSKPVYPAAEKRKFQFANEPLAVYEGEAQIRLPLRAEKNAAKGARSLPLSIRVQACDHEQCFPPATLTMTMAIEVK